MCKLQTAVSAWLGLVSAVYARVDQQLELLTVDIDTTGFKYCKVYHNTFGYIVKCHSLINTKNTVKTARLNGQTDYMCI